MLVAFCPEVERPTQMVRRPQRHIDRQRRAGNPNNYLPDGRVRPGTKRWPVRQRQAKGTLAETDRRLAEGPKAAQGTLANRFLAMGDVLQIKKGSYRAVQRVFGRSVGRRAPGIFVERLPRKAESAGGKVIAFPTRTTALSRVCHCGRWAKKPLSPRWHQCPCGASAQRDLYSAQLARFVYRTEEGTHLLEAGRAAQAWPGAEPLLRAAIEQGRQNNEPAARPVPRSRPARGQSGSHATGRGAEAAASDVVRAANGSAVPESPGKTAVLMPRTPRL